MPAPTPRARQPEKSATPFNQAPRSPDRSGRGREPEAYLSGPLLSTYFLTAYSSIGLSFGFAQAALVASLTGRPIFAPAGGIGCMNHLS
jgi:hypothetical protein